MQSQSRRIGGQEEDALDAPQVVKNLDQLRTALSQKILGINCPMA
jgi:hypothetical protein